MVSPQRSIAVAALLANCLYSPGWAQPPAAPPADANVQLNFPQAIEIQNLVDYVSQRLNIKILYDEQIANKQITIKAPTEIPASSLLSVLESALRMKGLLLVDADAPGWKRIVQAEQLPNVATRTKSDQVLEQLEGTAPVTQAFLLKHADVQKVDQLIKPFLSDPGANSIAVPESGLLVVTDYASNMVKVAQWIEFIDRPRVDVVLEFLPLIHVEAASLATQLTALLTAKAKAEGRPAGAPTIEIAHDVRTNQLILLGERSEVQATRRIITSLDVPLEVSANTYSFENVSAGRIDELVKNLLDPVIADRLYRSTRMGFSSFGLREVDPITGALAIIPGLGFNGTLVDPDVADVVLRALTNHRRSRVLSAPRILVNDNAEGQLSSGAEVPFTSINASNTVATTSFAGFAKAGTTITVTPHISDDDHLQLDFVVTLNTFTGSGGDGVPPPRQTDEVRSQVTIPDGHTVIVGGLNRRGQTWEFTSLPFVDHVPLLRYLGGSETKGQSNSSMFIFLRPVVLRDDKFRDLKYVSQRDVECAGECPDFPTSAPIWLP
jgi:type II secretory pathway component GspD/PulD (secretin)